MSKQILLEKYIKKAVLKQLKEQEEQALSQERSIYMIYRFPGMKKLMVDLMSPSFPRFLKNVEIIAPKPTTFNVKLINDMDFNIIYNGRGNFTVKVNGKKYNIQNLGELERASQSIANNLELSYNPTEAKQPATSPEMGGGAPGELSTTGGSFGGGNMDQQSMDLKADLDAAESELTGAPTEQPATPEAAPEAAPEEEQPEQPV